VAVGVLGVGGWLAFGDFLTPRGSTSDGAISLQASMAGFTPREIVVSAGQEVSLEFWTQDSSIHLERGVHTLNSEDLGLAVELPGADAVASSRISVTFTAPTEAGTYEVFCDTCCGGRANPTMRGTVRVEA
jgi:heme/copper-type cytochrome/quinol oxidase subunit 2